VNRFDPSRADWARILIVERSREDLEVLETAVQRRGLETIGTRQPDVGLQMIRDHNPDLILLDIESISTDYAKLFGRFEAESQSRRTPLVLLGKNQRSQRDMPSGVHVPTPYHYAPLLRRIEELLDRPQRSGGTAAA